MLKHRWRDRHSDDDDDELDGCVLVIEAPEENLTDDEVLGIVLFIDIDTDDPEAVERRRAEWVELAVILASARGADDV